jgi:hypothetical protein
MHDAKMLCLVVHLLLSLAASAQDNPAETPPAGSGQMSGLASLPVALRVL